MSKICETCGQQVNDKDFYCAFCGANLKMQANQWTSYKIPSLKTPISSPPQQSPISDPTPPPISRVMTPVPSSFPPDRNLNSQLLADYVDLVQKLEPYAKIEEGYNQHKQYYDALSRELQQLQQKYTQTKQQTQKEYQDVQNLKNLTWASIRASFRGDKEFQMQKEEKEYLIALNQENVVQQDLTTMQQKFNIAQKQLNELSQVVQIKRDLGQKLENIIDQACAGVIDPIEDQIEQQYAQLVQQRIPIANQRVQLKNALGHLQNALTYLNTALSSVHDASGLADWDTFFGGGLIVDSMKHSQMNNAQTAISQANHSVELAFQLVPNLPQVAKIQIEQLDFFWDAIFDNIFSDLRAREQIHRSRQIIEQDIQEIRQVIGWIEQQVRGLEDSFQKIESQISITRQNLLRERRRMIETALQKKL